VRIGPIAPLLRAKPAKYGECLLALRPAFSAWSSAEHLLPGIKDVRLVFEHATAGANRVHRADAWRKRERGGLRIVQLEVCEPWLLLSSLRRRLDANGEVECVECFLNLGRQRLLLGDWRRLGAGIEGDRSSLLNLVLGRQRLLLGDGRRFSLESEGECGSLLIRERQKLLLVDSRRLGADGEVEFLRNLEDFFLSEIARRPFLVEVARRLKLGAL
jgi:hypothetical protein